MTKRKDSKYWEGRIAKETWRTYNSLEERNRKLLEMYQEASQKISQELYKIAEKINGGQSVTLTDMHKFSRLGKLRKNFEKIVEELGEQSETFARGNMQKGFENTYKQAAAAISPERFTVPNQQLMDEMLERPWQGSTFSKRLWTNSSALASALNEDLLTGLQQGKTIAEISIALANRMQQGFNAAHRLVRTETIHYLNSAALRSYEDRGVTHVQIWAAEDERTCEHCMQYHGKIYTIGKAPVLPIHANCRCTYLPVVEPDEILAAKSAERNTFTSVKYTPNADYTIELPEYNESVNRGLSKAAKEVAILGTKDGNEHLRLIDLKSGDAVFEDDSGTPNSIGGQAFWDFLEKFTNVSVAFVHNHNTDSFFSETDLRTLLTEESIPVMIAVRNDGVKYVIKRKPNTPMIRTMFDDLYPEELEELMAKIKTGEVPRIEYSRRREELIVNNLIRDYTEGGIEFDGRKGDARK